MVDGTQWGNRYASCLQVVTDHGDFLLDLELTKTSGNEREGTLKVTDRCAGRFGDGFLHLIAGDGLYPCEPIFTGLRNHGIHAVVKMKAEVRDRLLVTRRAWDRVLHRDPSVEIISGIDHARRVLYRIEVIDEVKTDNYDDLLKVVHVIEEPIPNEECSDGERAFEALALLMFLAFNLIKAFRESLDAGEVRRWVGRTVISLADVVSVLIVTLRASTGTLVLS